MNLEIFGNDIAVTVRICNGILISVCQLLAIFVIAVGVSRGLVIFFRELLLKPQSPEAFQRSRLAMGYSFSLGLSFLVGASILKTMISSEWNDIARLVIVIAIRTALNYLLIRAINTPVGNKDNNKTEETEKVIKPELQS